MTHDAFGLPNDLHGRQVGVGTLVTATLYNRLADLDPSTIDIEARIAAHPAWREHADVLAGRFGALADMAVLIIDINGLKRVERASLLLLLLLPSSTISTQASLEKGIKLNRLIS